MAHQRSLLLSAAVGVLGVIVSVAGTSCARQEHPAARSSEEGAARSTPPDVPMTWEAYLSLPSVSALAWAPQGTRIAYVANPGGKPGVFLVDAATGGSSQRLVDGTSPAWSPDGTRLAYLADGDIWTIPVAGGTPVRVTQGPEDEREIAWSPDGKQIAFMSSRGGAQDVWVVGADGGSPKQLTTKAMDADDGRFAAEWSPDGRGLLFVSNRAKWDHDDLWLAPAAGGEPKRLTTSIRTRFSPVWSPDGKAIALQAFGHEEFSYGDMTDLYLVDPASGHERKLKLPNYISGQPAWSPDSREVLFAVVEHANSNIWRVSIDDETHPTKVTYLDGTVSQYNFSPDGKWIAFLHNSPVRPAALKVMPALGGEPRTLADVAPPLATARAPREVAYRSYDGKYIHGFLYLPPDADKADARLPALVEVHGGGTNLYRNGFNAIEQAFAQKGFIVLAVNYRGSSSYGRTFQDLSTLDWCNGQAQDAAEAATYLRSLPIANGKVGIYGYSYGGITSMAAAARFPEAFDAAVPMAGIYDFALAYPPADRVGKLFYELGHGGSPTTNPAAYAHSNTISHVPSVKAPILELHGEADVRAPFNQQAALAAALKQHNKVFEIHSYPGEPHGFRKLANRADLYTRAEAWFNKYLH